MSSKLTTWVDEEIEFFRQTVKLKLKLPPFGGAAALVKRVEQIRAARDPELVFTPENLAWVQDIFAKWVRLAEPLEVDGETFATGIGLLEVVNVGFVYRVLGKLCRLAYLAEAEGKVSESPSTPSVESGSGNGGSSYPVPSIEGEAGPMP